MAYIDKSRAIGMLERFREEHSNLPNACLKMIDVALNIIKQIHTADVAEVKQIEIIRDDLKWWLETNAEKGVVYIPKFVVENMIVKMGGERSDT